jgi:hypothetical protein
MQARIGGALYYAKPALRVGPYLSSFCSNQVNSITCFYEPTMFKSLQLTVDNYLINQELQGINYTKASQFQFKP